MGELASMYFHGSWRCPGQLPLLPSPIATRFGITAKGILVSLRPRDPEDLQLEVYVPDACD
jgi:hypothetical protein